MLADRARRRWSTNFAGQWLYLRNLAARSRTRASFRISTTTSAGVAAGDRAVLRQHHAGGPQRPRSADGRLHLRERTAGAALRHSAVYGSRSAASPWPRQLRGGLLGQGSILTVTSYANRTSPVLRGKWILENILGTPPPPPPPNVPPLEDTSAGGKVLRCGSGWRNTGRTLPAPAAISSWILSVCRWRTSTPSDAGGTETPMVQPVDVTGSLPSGVTFDGVDGLKKALLDHPDALCSYGQRKTADLCCGARARLLRCSAVRAIVRDARNKNYRFSSLIAGVVKSTPFQMRRSQ